MPEPAHKTFLTSTVYATPLMTPTTALGLSIRLSMFELRETNDWDIFLGPPERAETGGADQWVLKRRELPGVAIVNEKKRPHSWDSHHQFSKTVLSNWGGGGAQNSFWKKNVKKETFSNERGKIWKKKDTDCDEHVSVGVDVGTVVGNGVNGQVVNLGVGLGVGLVLGFPSLTSLNS